MLGGGEEKTEGRRVSEGKREKRSEGNRGWEGRGKIEGGGERRRKTLKVRERRVEDREGRDEEKKR